MPFGDDILCTADEVSVRSTNHQNTNKWIWHFAPSIRSMAKHDTALMSVPAAKVPRQLCGDSGSARSPAVPLVDVRQCAKCCRAIKAHHYSVTAHWSVSRRMGGRPTVGGAIWAGSRRGHIEKVGGVTPIDSQSAPAQLTGRWWRRVRRKTGQVSASLLVHSRVGLRAVWRFKKRAVWQLQASAR